MPSKRLNHNQRKNLKRRNKDGYLAPPKDYGYPGRPIHRSHTDRLRDLIRETASSIKPRTDEEVRQQLDFLNNLDNLTSPELVKLLTDGGFKIVKYKELRVHVSRTDQPLQASPRFRAGAPLEERGATTVITINAR